ncbi:hypothetical protein Mal52_30520 [Symmachiella dynata]|uniref:Uncharacterized protein n=1 Tax=Symmachiella dynata TaxID=2527995 RepID=A0A517ZQ24_9PLAN|nr:hypothetical protein Mal52_30520 [Symmachiella dynata]
MNESLKNTILTIPPESSKIHANWTLCWHLRFEITLQLQAICLVDLTFSSTIIARQHNQLPLRIAGQSLEQQNHRHRKCEDVWDSGALCGIVDIREIGLHE